MGTGRVDTLVLPKNKRVKQETIEIEDEPDDKSNAPSGNPTLVPKEGLAYVPMASGKSLLLNLPLHIRINVYRYLLESSGHILQMHDEDRNINFKLGNNLAPVILRISQQIKEEAMPILYQRNHFWWNRINLANRNAALITHVHMTIIPFSYKKSADKSDFSRFLHGHPSVAHLDLRLHDDWIEATAIAMSRFCEHLASLPPSILSVRISTRKVTEYSHYRGNKSKDNLEDLATHIKKFVPEKIRRN